MREKDSYGEAKAAFEDWGLDITALGPNFTIIDLGRYHPNHRVRISLPEESTLHDNIAQPSEPIPIFPTSCEEKTPNGLVNKLQRLGLIPKRSP